MQDFRPLDINSINLIDDEFAIVFEITAKIENRINQVWLRSVLHKKLAVSLKVSA